jgi:hypothetical protein
MAECYSALHQSLRGSSAITTLALMKIFKFFLVIGLLVTTPSNAEEMTVIGRALSQKYIEGIEVPCPKNAICMNGWWRWEIVVERTLNGTPILGRIFAANVQHGQFTDSSLDRFKAFVIRRIEDAEKRKLLGADYLLLNQSAAHELYCFRDKPSDVQNEHFYFGTDNGGPPFCIEPPKISP